MSRSAGPWTHDADDQALRHRPGVTRRTAAKVTGGQGGRAGAGSVISPRDEIWIDMMQFDARAADRLWERSAPPQGAPEWYGEVSGLIETATGPAEPHELVDEPVVVEDMHRTTLGRSSRRCHRGRTVARVITVKAAVATAASVFGVAAAAAATTGIVATMVGVVVPLIEDDVVQVEDEPESTAPLAPAPGGLAGSPDIRLGDQLVIIAEAPTADSMPAASPRPATPEAAAATVGPSPAAAESDAAPAPVPPAQVVTGPVVIDPAAVTPSPPPATKPAHPTKSPPADTPPEEVAPRRDKPAGPGAAHRGSGPGRGHRADGKVAHSHEADTAVVEPVEHPPPAHSRRPG
jgi:hypothetical protein